MRHSASAKTCSLFSLCVFVPFVVCLALGCSGAPKHPSWKTATGAEQHERLLWESIQKKDWNEVERHLSPTFVGVSARGELFDRAGWLAYWKSGPPEEFALGEQSVQPEGPDMKVSYILQVGGAAHASGSREIRVVSVWQQVKSGWMLTATSLTPVQGN